MLSKIQERILLSLIIVTGLVLRFYKFGQIQFTHDELSALGRLHYNSFGELVRQGIMVEGHPAGTQVFLFFWTKIFGESTLAVKFPFVIFGVISIYLVYLIGKCWHRTSTGLVTASVFAVLQHSVFYSQVARPYSMAVFFMLLAVYGWSQYLFPKDPPEKKWRGLTWFIVGALGCAYSHHLSSYSVLIVGISGLFFLTKSTYKNYVIACGVILLGYLPHLSITIHQISLGGIGGPDGWLDAPEPSFPLDFLRCVFHFSWYFAIPFILVSGISFFWSKSTQSENKFRILAASWFAAVLVTAYIYSVTINPLLQFSSLVFVFPFLLILLFSFLPALSFRSLLLIIMVLMGTGSYSLIKQRKHYEMMLHQPYDYFARTSTTILNSRKGSTYLAFCGDENYLISPLLEKYGNKVKYIQATNDFRLIRKAIDKEQPALLFLQNINLGFLEVLKYEYPYFANSYYGFGFEYFALSKDPKDSLLRNNPYLYDAIALEQTEPKWIYSKTQNSASPAAITNSTPISADKEFGPGYTALYNEILTGDHNFLAGIIDFSADSNFTNAQLVISIEDGGKSIFYQTADLRTYFISPDTWQKAAIAVALHNLEGITPTTVVKIYIWNPEKQTFFINSFEVKAYRGNEKMHGIISAF